MLSEVGGVAAGRISAALGESRIAERLPVCQPERLKRPVKDREIFVTMHQETPQRVIHIVTPADVHVYEGFRGIEQPPDMDVEAERPQKMAEGEKPMLKLRRHVGPEPAVFRVSEPRRG